MTCEDCSWHCLTSNEYYDLTEEEYYNPKFAGKLVTEWTHYCLRLDYWFSEDADLKTKAEACSHYKKKKNKDEIIIYDQNRRK